MAACGVPVAICHTERQAVSALRLACSYQCQWKALEEGRQQRKASAAPCCESLSLQWGKNLAGERQQEKGQQYKWGGTAQSSRDPCRVCTCIHTHTLQACLYSTHLSHTSQITLIFIPMLGERGYTYMCTTHCWSKHACTCDKAPLSTLLPNTGIKWFPNSS